VALVERAVAVHGSKNPGMMLINNPWGESNEKGLTAALEAKGLPTAGIERIEANDIDVVPQLTRLKDAGADTIFMVANVGPSAQVMKSLERMGWDVPVVSHWGPAGGRFSELAGPRAKDVEMIQTFTFSGNDSPKAAATLEALKVKFPEITGPADVTPAVGIANAYDAMHLTALAIQNAGSTDGPAIRQGYYDIETYEGLIKTYVNPFTPEDQDALGAEDYIFTRFIDGEIIPID
jgi:branched-chain amino acid transport system substrate-binding protein